jgi:hypothetical protein
MSGPLHKTLIDIADLDVIFLTYDEPQKEEFWHEVKNIVPWAKRVDGIKGSDAAHKAAGAASDTERFVIVDGDNIPNAEFFNLQLVLDDSNKDCVFRWKARNHINGLIYGNGGISCWTKTFVSNMRTHEATDGRAESLVEFCFEPNYWAMHDCYSTTHPNQSPFQAWRAGFREGVKMCLDRGSRPSLSEFKQRVHSRNLDHLSIWQYVGIDVDNGAWAIAGAKMGTWQTMLADWDYTLVQDFAELEHMWNTQVSMRDPLEIIDHLGQDLHYQLNLPPGCMQVKNSAFFKHHYRSNYKNQGIMIRDQ